MNQNKKLIYIVSALFALCTLGLALVLLFLFPSKADLPEGFRTPIIAFEFAKSEADLSYLAGNGEVEKYNRDQMDVGHQWDMVFPFAYGGFLFMLLWQLLLKGHRIVWIGIPFAILIIPFDIYENLVLLDITEALRSSKPVIKPLSQLHIATWLKWGTLGMSITLLSIGFTKNKAYVSAFISAVTALSFVICKVLEPNPTMAELMALFTSLFFLFFTLKTGGSLWRLLVNRPVR